MEQKYIIIDVIESLSSYYKKQESFTKVFSHEPVISKAIEVFDIEMDEMIDHILDLIGLPEEEPKNKYDKPNWTRNVCTHLIEIAAREEKYITPAVELIIDWKNLSDHALKVEKHTWFRYHELLDEHLTGYKSWHEKQREKKS